MATTHGVTTRELELAMESDDDDIDALLAACDAPESAVASQDRGFYVCRACGVDTATVADGKCACWGY